MTIIGAVLIFFGLNKFFKVLKGNNKPQSITIGTVQSNTITTTQPKISYQAWTCPKCGERNNYAAKNCINCFEPKP